MTKKDYELFAQKINEMGGIDEVPAFSTKGIVSMLILVFRADNPAFKSEKFIEACNTGKHIRKSISGKA